MYWLGEKSASSQPAAHARLVLQSERRDYGTTSEVHSSPLNLGATEQKYIDSADVTKEGGGETGRHTKTPNDEEWQLFEEAHARARIRELMDRHERQAMGIHFSHHRLYWNALDQQGNESEDDSLYDNGRSEPGEIERIMTEIFCIGVVVVVFGLLVVVASLWLAFKMDPRT